MTTASNSKTLPELPKRLPDKLKAIREGLRFTPDAIAPKVGPKNGAEITEYENDERDLSVRVLFAYAKLAGVSFKDLIQDDRELWSNGKTRRRLWKNSLLETVLGRGKERTRLWRNIIGLLVGVLLGGSVAVFGWHWSYEFFRQYGLRTLAGILTLFTVVVLIQEVRGRRPRHNIQLAPLAYDELVIEVKKSWIFGTDST